MIYVKHVEKLSYADALDAVEDVSEKLHTELILRGFPRHRAAKIQRLARPGIEAVIMRVLRETGAVEDKPTLLQKAISKISPEELTAILNWSANLDQELK